ncbi:hypothetical protein DLD77_05880 [Chitinophaga alhagiae]|uniref:Uncharacterized protein n=1 Tax=Chitinophaga alhagiae TaxID=2203219 RepID=A0ABM6WBR5_9BACT|nr:DUF5522 domain-containing protein [Chitinophaga alhagiae]AWO01253.1 hypothetical protein DLD77_05880 [Chitinophaga alhagiae]
MKQPLKENIDFYYNEQGYVVLTEKYHRERGYCCGNGCLHCPFDYENVPENKKGGLLAARKARGKQGGQ